MSSRRGCGGCGGGGCGCGGCGCGGGLLSRELLSRMNIYSGILNGASFYMYVNSKPVIFVAPLWAAHVKIH